MEIIDFPFSIDFINDWDCQWDTKNIGCGELFHITLPGCRQYDKFTKFDVSF